MSLCRQESTDSTCVLTLQVFVLRAGTAVVPGSKTVESSLMKVSKVIVNTSCVVHFGSPNLCACGTKSHEKQTFRCGQ